ncbi:hypothetical protein [Streptomyces sp. NPDC058653]|uniref:hypothetical protein n=1 Tax=Streptomyces sp. NPDC058653 TaxID=3346576 RepID=UPI00364C7A45
MSENAGRTNKERLDGVLRRRREQLPLVDAQIEQWHRIQGLIGELGDTAAGGTPAGRTAVAGTPVGGTAVGGTAVGSTAVGGTAAGGTAPASTAPAATPADEGEPAAALRRLDVAEMARAARDCLEVLGTVRRRVSRATVNIGVSGRARNGKSTVLQSLSGLDDRQIPSGRGQPVTAVRSRIYHSSTDRGARLTMHTEASFLRDVIAPYHEELGLLPAPRDLAEFVRYRYPSVADGVEGPDQPRLAPILARVREAHEALDSYRGHLTGEARTVDLTDIRAWVAYPDAGSGPAARPYLAVKDAAITCAFPVEDVTALGLVDMPGLGELVPEAEAHHLEGLRNDVDFVIVVKRPTDTNAMWAEEDARALQLIGSVCTVADVRDFAAVLVNTGDCLPENVKALDDDLRERLNGLDSERGYWVILADGADRDTVRDQVLQPILEHLADALPRMDRLVIEDAVAVCQDRRDRIESELAAWSDALRAAFVPTTTEQTIARAEELRAEVAASVQEWVDLLRVRAADDYEDTEFYERVAEVHRDVRAWVLDGFGEGGDVWRERALSRFRVDRASLPFASGELNRVRVEMARRFSAVDDLLTRRRDEYWAGLVTALGPRFALLAEEPARPGPSRHQSALPSSRRVSKGVEEPRQPQDVLAALADILGNAPDPCPGLAGTLRSALDVRLDYRTRMLPRLRRALGVLLPEPDDVSDKGPTSLLAVERTAAGAELLFDRVTQLARQAAYDAHAVLAQEPGTTAQALFAYGEQFEDALVRSDSSAAEFRRLVGGFQDRVWPDDARGPRAATERLRQVRSLLGELRELITAEAPPGTSPPGTWLPGALPSAPWRAGAGANGKGVRR